MRAYRLACLSPNCSIGEQTGNTQYAKPGDHHNIGENRLRKIRQQQADVHPAFFPVSGTTLPKPAAPLAQNRPHASISFTRAPGWPGVPRYVVRR